MKRDELVKYLDEYLRISEITDESQNGLQVEGAEKVNRICYAVDGCFEAFQKATVAGVHMIIVHHGIFWGGFTPLRGIQRQRIKQLLDNNLSLYAVHLPLDLHPKVGNNVQLAKLLGLKVTGPFGEYHGISIGVEAELKKEVSLEEFIRMAEEKLGGKMRVVDFGPKLIRRVGIVSGGAGSLVNEAGQKGLDLYFTGEPSHSAFRPAQEYGVNIIYGGHYLTETVGLKALARHLERKFGLEPEFIELPTGF